MARFSNYISITLWHILVESGTIQKDRVPCTSTIALEDAFPCLFQARQLYFPSSSNIVLSITNVELLLWSSMRLLGNGKLSFAHDTCAAGSALVLQISTNFSPAWMITSRSGDGIRGKTKNLIKTIHSNIRLRKQHWRGYDEKVCKKEQGETHHLQPNWRL